MGEILTYQEEPGDIHDLYAVAVKRPADDTTVGHNPRTMYTILYYITTCCLFLRRGSINCEVTGSRQYSSDLLQGGLEVPCSLTFIETEGDTNTVEQLLNHAPTNITIYTKSVTPASQLIEPASKKR
jgi:hypothetical protein